MTSSPPNHRSQDLNLDDVEGNVYRKAICDDAPKLTIHDNLCGGEFVEGGWLRATGRAPGALIFNEAD